MKMGNSGLEIQIVVGSCRAMETSSEILCYKDINDIPDVLKVFIHHSLKKRTKRKPTYCQKRKIFLYIYIFFYEVIH